MKILDNKKSDKNYNNVCFKRMTKSIFKMKSSGPKKHWMIFIFNQEEYTIQTVGLLST